MSPSLPNDGAPFSGETFRRVADASIDAIVVIDRGGAIRYWNQAAARLFEYRPEEVIGQYVNDILPPPAAREKVDAAFRHYQQTGSEEVSGSLISGQVLSKSGRAIHVQFSFNVLEVDGEQWAYAFIRDISEIVKLEAKLRHLAMVDELTGVLNRRAFEAQGRQAYSRALRERKPLCVLMLDLDHFKTINDQLGHAGGDRALQRFAECVERSLRDEDIFGRTGGEEFCIALLGNTLEQARTLANRIRLAVAEELVPEGAPKLTVSIGCAQLHAEETGLADVQRRADLALYQAKREGRNRVCVAE